MQATIQWITQELLPLYPPEEIRGMVRLIFFHLRRYSSTDLLLKTDEKLSASELAEVKMMVERLKKQEPIQYVTGETEFCGLTIGVNPSVLIPRPETEELVDWIFRHEKERPQSVLDIGTGSGCLALACKKLFPEAAVSGCDISEAALDTARQNARQNKLEVSFFQTDILEWEQTGRWREVDLVVSNPPYVTESERNLMLPNVLEYEPASALFVPDTDPLLFYRTIALFARRWLNPGGRLIFEINEKFGKEVENLLAGFAFRDIEIRSDLQGKSRMVKAIKENK